MFDAERIKKTEKPLLAWFRQSARELPWRDDPTPYHVWISEIMLQQTRVEAVRPYYHRFISRLPDIRALALCPEGELMKLWEGLGYYSRARNLQKAAQIVMAEYNGRLPRDEGKLLALPGIGSYTAGAVASIAYGLAVPAVDGNVLRVMSRICESGEDILLSSVKTELERVISSVMPSDCPGQYNQALMELGALVCVPGGAPECAACPVSDLCLSCLHGTTDRIPRRRAKKPRRIEEKTILVIRDALRVVIARREEKGLLAGLYEFPSVPGLCGEEEALDYVRGLSLSPLRILPLPAAKHVFTHVEWHMRGYLILVEDMDEISEDERILAVEPSQTGREYAIPSAFRTYARALDLAVGKEAITGNYRS